MDGLVVWRVDVLPRVGGLGEAVCRTPNALLKDVTWRDVFWEVMSGIVKIPEKKESEVMDGCGLRPARFRVMMDSLVSSVALLYLEEKKNLQCDDEVQC